LREKKGGETCRNEVVKKGGGRRNKEGGSSLSERILVWVKGGKNPPLRLLGRGREGIPVGKGGNQLGAAERGDDSKWDVKKRIELAKEGENNSSQVGVGGRKGGTTRPTEKKRKRIIQEKRGDR